MTASTGAQRFARLMHLSSVLLLGVVVASCATVDATSTQYVGAQLAPDRSGERRSTAARS